MSTVNDIISFISYRIDHPEFIATDGYDTLLAHVNRCIKEIDEQLFSWKSDLAMNDLSVSFQIGDGTEALPTGFIGLFEAPWISGNTTQLSLLPDLETRLKYTENGTPEYYEVSGTNLKIYPSPDAATTVLGRYFKYTASLTSRSSTIPYSGIFDSVIQDYLIKIYWLANQRQATDGQFLIALDQADMNEVKRAVRRVLVGRQGQPTDRVVMRSWL